MKTGANITISSGIRRFTHALQCRCQLHDEQYLPVYEQAPDGSITGIQHRYICYRCRRVIRAYRQEFSQGSVA